MKPEQIFANLCQHDPRYPNPRDHHERSNPCGCYNCYHGRNKLALELLKAENRNRELLKKLTRWNKTFKSCVTSGARFENNVFVCLNARYTEAKETIDKETK